MNAIKMRLLGSEIRLIQHSNYDIIVDTYHN